MPEDKQNNKDNINNDAADTGLDDVNEPQGGAAPASDTSSAVSSSDLTSDTTAASSVASSATPEAQSPEPAVVSVGNTPVATPVTPTVSNGEKKNNKMLIWGLMAVVVVAIVAVVLVLVFSGSKQLSAETVKKYCNDNGFTVTTKHQDDYDVDTVTCSTTDYDAAVSQIEYTVAKKPITELEGYNSDAEDILSYFGGETLVDNGSYKKIYVSFIGQAIYVVIRDNTVIMISGTNEGVKKALIDLGYPDDKWGESGDGYSSWEDTGLEYIDEQDAEDALQRSQKDTQRRSDMSRVVTALISYQTNNGGNLPEGPSYWRGVETIDCDSSDTTCIFVRDYLNSGGAANTFLDPAGEPYSIDITENLVSNGSISSDHGNMFSYLEESSDGYTIGGTLPFDEYVVFVVPGGQCGNNGNVVRAKSERSVAVTYMLEMGEAYCIDSI